MSRSPRIAFTFAMTAALGLGACSSDSTPTGSPPPQVLAVFSDPATGLSTNDVYDVDGDQVRFDTAAGTLIWIQTGATFTGFPVDGSLVGAGHPFEVRFGGGPGGRRAYFTERGPGTLCDIAVGANGISIQPTAVPVPP